MKIRRCSPVIFASLVALLLGVNVWLAVGQPVSPFYVTIDGGQGQSALRVNPNTTPNRVEIGCDGDRLGNAIVNGVRFVGAVTGSGPTISGLPCVGGDPNRTLNIAGAGSGGVTLTNGIDTTVTTGQIVLPALERCRGDAAAGTLQNSLIPVRAASGDWSIQRTAAGAETINIHCDMTFPGFDRTTASKGVRVDSFSIIQQITVVNLTSNTFNGFTQTVYANNVADAVTNCCGSITVTMPTVVQANPYVTAATVGTPTFQNTAAATYGLDFTVVMANTGVYSLKGILVTYTTALY